MTAVRSTRQCSRSACSRPAVATLTYVYTDSTAVLGPLALNAEPHCYDLCTEHAERLTAPRGWEVVRLAVDLEHAGPTPDDLAALAEAVREASRAVVPAKAPALRPALGQSSPLTSDASQPRSGRRAHLRVLPGDGE